MNETPHAPIDEALRLCLLRYLEGTMSPKEREDFERELRASPATARELDALKDMMDLLTTDKTVFCPDLSDIAEFLDSGHDPEGRVSRHLDECPACAEHALTLGAARPSTGLPPEIWVKVRETLSRHTGRTSAPKAPSRISRFLRWCSGLFPRPAFAFAAAAAIALMVIALYPARPPQPQFALSAISWNDELTPKSLSPPSERERVAFLLQVPDRNTIQDQQRIDALYEALKPGEADLVRREFIDPARVNEALSSDAASIKEAVLRLHSRLSVNKIVLISLSRRGDTIMVRCETVGAATGAPTGAPVETTAHEATVAATVRKAAYGALDLGRKGHK
jgi:hypothetical protein